LGFLRDFGVVSEGCASSWAKNGVAGVKVGGLGKSGKRKVRKNAPKLAKKEIIMVFRGVGLNRFAVVLPLADLW
jgi:hypothetical protein